MLQRVRKNLGWGELEPILGMCEAEGNLSKEQGRTEEGADSEREERMGVKGLGRTVFLAEAGKGRVSGKDKGARAEPQRMGWLGGLRGPAGTGHLNRQWRTRSLGGAAETKEDR